MKPKPLRDKLERITKARLNELKFDEYYEVFSKEDVKLAVEWLKKQFNSNTCVCDHGKEGLHPVVDLSLCLELLEKAFADIIDENSPPNSPNGVPNGRN